MKDGNVKDMGIFNNVISTQGSIFLLCVPVLTTSVRGKISVFTDQIIQTIFQKQQLTK